ncbi:MAG: DUF3048 domain-containing protein [Anaerolineae bacterium]|nr:DUF3048 domain-containing protein [Anaerolineae bacterium]
MKRSRLLSILPVSLLAFAALTACRPAPTIPPTPTATPRAEPTTVAVVPAAAPTEIPPTPTATPVPPTGPTGFPPNANPLTGQFVSDPTILDRRPILVKVSNNPPEIRPYQAGLQSADHVWEHQVEGFALTRFSVIIYGQEPERVGSVRSGRQPDLEMVPMYQALYVAAGFSTNHKNPDEPWRMREYMLNAPWRVRNFSEEFGTGAPYNQRIPQDELAYEHTLFAIPTELWKLAAERDLDQRVNLDGLAFDPIPPNGGTPTTEVTIDYPGVGPKVTWRYDMASGDWLRWSDDVVHIDALTQEQLHFDNVVILYAWNYQTDWPEDTATGELGVGIDLFGTGEAVLLRDGYRYPLTWSRESEFAEKMMTFTDSSGRVVPFKPGQTWFQVASSGYGPPAVTLVP